MDQVTTDPVATTLSSLYGLLEEAAGTDSLDPLDFGDERTRLDLIREHRDRPLRVAIIGEFSTGKSTFINAILGQNLLPARFLPTTRQVMCIHHSDGPGQVALAALRPSQGESALGVKVDDDATDEAVPVSTESTAPRALSQQSILDLAESGEPLDITVPIPAPWTDLEVYDTPGVNDATTMAESVIFDLMDHVDVVVFMLRAQQALTASEAKFLAHLVRRKDLNKFFFAINFCDGLSAAEADSVRADVAKTLAERRNWPFKALADRLFLCSAKQTLDTALGQFVPTETDHPNEHEKLLSAVHADAMARKRALLQDATDGLLRAVAESAAQKLEAALVAANDEEAKLASAIKDITQTVTDFRVAIREEELALRQRIFDRKAVLRRDVTDMMAAVEHEIVGWVSHADLDELAGDAVGKRIRVELEERLPPLLASFRDDVSADFADLDRRILPMMNRATTRIEGIRRGIDLGPMLAGTSLTAAGYLAVTAAFPWVLGATGTVAVAAGLASLIPGVGSFVGAGLGAAAMGLPRFLLGAASGTASIYRWLRDGTRDWQARQTRDAYGAQLAQLIANLRSELTKGIDEGIDPAEILDAALAARFPQGPVLEERRLLSARLDRERLRGARENIERLRAGFIAAIPARTT